MEYSLLDIQMHPYLIRFDTNQTEEKCIAAVQLDWTTLQYVKEQTDKICKAAVSNHGDALQYVHNATTELCNIAVDTNSFAYRFVPATIATSLKQQHPKTCLSQGYIKYGKPTEDECLAAIKDDSENIVHCFERYYNTQFYTKAVRSNPKCMRYICGMGLSKSLYELAIKLDYTLFGDLDLQPVSTYEHVYKNYGWAKFKKLCKVRDNNMYFVSLKDFPEHWRLISNNEQEESIDRGMDINPSIIKYINPSKLNYEKCLRAVKHNWRNMQFVPEQYQTLELCKVALNYETEALTYIINQTSAVIDHAKAIDRGYDRYVRTPKPSSDDNTLITYDNGGTVAISKPVPSSLDHGITVTFDHVNHTVKLSTPAPSPVPNEPARSISEICSTVNDDLNKLSTKQPQSDEPVLSASKSTMPKSDKINLWIEQIITSQNTIEDKLKLVQKILEFE